MTTKIDHVRRGRRTCVRGGQKGEGKKTGPTALNERSPRNRWIAFGITLQLAVLALACGPGGGGLADNGGMSGTGVSQGSISSFGSIFVNGAEWDLSSASIEIDGVAASDTDLRVGMVVRVEGDFDAGNMTGTATRVRFEDLLEGPIASVPIETVPGQVKTFAILGQSVTVDVLETRFDGGATFATLAAGDVLEVSGFPDGSGAIAASRVSLRGAFPADDDVSLVGPVANRVVNVDDSGMFDLGTITVRFTPTTPFTQVTRAALMNGDRVKVKGTLRLSETEIDATEIELEEDGVGVDDLDRVEIEGVAETCASSPDFCVDGVPVDISMASFDPPTFVPMVGDRIEVEGPLVAGTLEATEVKSEEEDANQRNVRVDAEVTSVDPVGRTLVVLGVTFVADGNTVLEDDSSVGDENFKFVEILVGDFVEVRGVDDGGATVRALSIDREDATSGVDDVRLEGPVTALDTLTPTIEILGQAIPLDMGTLYFDDTGTARTEEEFFRTPGDVMIGDIVSVKDAAAADLTTIGQGDEVSLEGPI